jgi:hypothetical protein
MSTVQPWINGVLRKFSVREKRIDAPRFHQYRKLMDRSRLPERMNATCIAIGVQAGKRLRYQENLVRPYPVIRRYILEKDNLDLIMELAILFEGPRVLFSANKAKPWIKVIQRYFGYLGNEKNNVVCELAIDPMTVSDEEVRQWVIYFLSGLQDSYKPRIPVPLLNKG